MRRPRLFIAALAILAALAAVLLASRLSRAPVPPANNGATSIGVLPTAEELTPPAMPQGSSSSSLEEQASSPSIGYLPPPNTNLTGSSLGRQRVPLPDAVSDIHQLFCPQQS